MQPDKDWLDARLSWKPEIAWLHLQVAKGEAVSKSLPDELL